MRVKNLSGSAASGSVVTTIIVTLTLGLFFALMLTIAIEAFAADAAAPSPAAPPPPAAAPDVPPASMTVLGNHEVEGILGREVVSTANENMGRIADVIVDHHGQVRAAIIDFGGFLGVGSRKIAVEWSALHFSPQDKPDTKITLELTRDQVKAAPEYQDGKPVVVLGALGKLEPLPFE
ncbi:MAG TPA: PRC-barrel domain-containing protein [Xanthobacteraceae bacterium]|jgi:hypothetical protein|nr:PRC-barrel domain-containing protein [Xanthobacteraceae bacterium]